MGYHYVIGDIHNEYVLFCKLISQLNLSAEDEIILLGDVFDRGINPNPLDLYHKIRSIPNLKWTVGNHDIWLATYIMNYVNATEKERRTMVPYRYNTFQLLKERMTDEDLRDLASYIFGLPHQLELKVKGEKVLLAHAKTVNPSKKTTKRDFYMGDLIPDSYFEKGVPSYISYCGHERVERLDHLAFGRLLDGKKSIWRNDWKNLYLLDTGAGYSGGVLSCICLETGARFYSKPEEACKI